MAPRRLLLSCVWKFSPCVPYKTYSITDQILAFSFVNVQRLNSSLLKIKMLHSVGIDIDDHQKIRKSLKDDSRSKLQRRSSHILHLYKLYNLQLYQEKNLLARINKTAAQIETSFDDLNDKNVSELRRMYLSLCDGSVFWYTRKSLKQDLQRCSYEDLLALFSLTRSQDTPYFDRAFLFGEELVRRENAAEINRKDLLHVSHYEQSFENKIIYYLVFFGLSYEKKFVYLKFVSLFLAMVDNYFELVDKLGDSKGKACVMFSLLSIMAIGNSPPLLWEKLERYILKNFHLFSINDLGFVCMGFFTSRTKVTNHELMEKIATALLDTDFAALELMTVSYMFKTFRYTGYLRQYFYSEFGKKFVNSSLPDKCKLMDLMHVIQTYTTLHIYNEPMFRLLEQVLLQWLDKSRVRNKDLSRVMEAFGTFLYEPRDPELYKKVEQVALNMARTDGHYHYPEHTVDILVSLVNLGRFPQQLVSLVFSSEYHTVFTDDSKAIERDYQLLLLDRSVRLEMPQYTGPWISADRIEMFQKTASERESKQKEHRHALLRSFEVLKSLLGQDRVHCHCILSHINTVDIEIQLNRRMTPVPFASHKIGTVRNPLPHGVDVQSLWSDIKEKCPNRFDRLAIEFIGVNQCQRGMDIPLGPMHLKMRQLKKLGYEICMVYPSDPVQVRALDMSQSELYEYWKKRLTEEYSIVL